MKEGYSVYKTREDFCILKNKGGENILIIFEKFKVEDINNIKISYNEDYHVYR